MRIVTDLQYKYFGRDTRNSLISTTSAANDKHAVFPVVECLHDTIKDVAQCITCIPIKPNDIIHIKCDLFFCDEYPEYIIPNEGLDDGPNASITQFSVYTYQGRCATNGIFPNGPSV